MRRLITRLLVIYLLLATFGMTAAVIALRQPPSAWSDTLRLDECELPCWMGITPGQTRLEDAVDVVQRTFGDPARYTLDVKAAVDYWWKSTVRVNETGAAFDILLSRGYPANAISHIDLVFYAPQPTMPELVTDIGRATSVREHFTGDVMATTVWFEDSTYYLDVGWDSCGNISLDMRVVRLHIGQDTGRYQSSERWRGFGHCHYMGWMGP